MDFKVVCLIANSTFCSVGIILCRDWPAASLEFVKSCCSWESPVWRWPLSVLLIIMQNGDTMKMVFLSEPSLCHCAVNCFTYIVSLYFNSCNPTLKDKNYYYHFKFVDREPGAAEEFVQGHMVCKWCAPDPSPGLLTDSSDSEWLHEHSSN